MNKYICDLIYLYKKVNFNYFIMKTILPIILLFISMSVSAEKVYDPSRDANKDIEMAIKQAQKENKHVLIQVGGNWCPWCIKMHKYINNNNVINKIVSEKYVYIHVNYSKENKNLAIMKRLEYPQRFGFPVLVVLNTQGQRIHTQSTGILEKEKSYDQKKMFSFLNNWTFDSINPKNYK